MIVDIFKIEKLREVNKIILNNLEIEEKEKYENNEDNLYLVKYKLIKMIKDF